MRTLRKRNFAALVGVPVRLFGDALPFVGKFQPGRLGFGVLSCASHRQALAGPIAVLFCVFCKHSGKDYSGEPDRALNQDIPTLR
jgi:hypothetical protein